MSQTSSNSSSEPCSSVSTPNLLTIVCNFLRQQFPQRDIKAYEYSFQCVIEIDACVVGKIIDGEWQNWYHISTDRDGNTKIKARIYNPANPKFFEQILEECKQSLDWAEKSGMRGGW